MANLSRQSGLEDSENRRDRGQILLIAAFALAVIFVALALVVNSAIFTENLASRGEVSGSSDALTYQHEVEGAVAAAIRHANVYDEGSLGSSLGDSVDAIASQGRSQQARNGQLVHVDLLGDTDGTRIADNASGGSAFTSSSGLANWNLAENVEETRDVVITTRYGDLPTIASPFRLVANETATPGTVWELELWRDGANNAVVRVSTADGDTAQCRIPVAGSGRFDVDVTGGFVDGKRCGALTRDGASGTPMWFGTGIPSGSTYAIDVENGNTIQGNYSMVVRPAGSWNATTLVDGEATGTPYRTDAIYGATVSYLYRTDQVTYETEVAVEPGATP